ncbi:hypothetical protein [Streptomyces sp. NPDC051561]
MRDVNVQSQSWLLDEELVSVDEAEELEETETAYSFSYARI